MQNPNELPVKSLLCILKWRKCIGKFFFLIFRFSLTHPGDTVVTDFDARVLLYAQPTFDKNQWADKSNSVIAPVYAVLFVFRSDEEMPIEYPRGLPGKHFQLNSPRTWFTRSLSHCPSRRRHFSFNLWIFKYAYYFFFLRIAIILFLLCSYGVNS